MYHSYWGLDREPFSGRSGLRFHASAAHEEALARLEFVVHQRRRFSLLLGPPGSGKSLALAVLAGQLRRRGRPVAKINLHGLAAEEFLWILAAELQTPADPDVALHVLWQRVMDRLAEHRYQKLESVLLLDDADAARQDTLHTVIRLIEHEDHPDPTLVVVASASPDRLGQLGRHLLERAELRIDLEPWDEAETERFVTQALVEAGGKAEVFQPEAIRRLYELTQGVPRRVRQLADLALLAGAGQQLERIDAATITSVYHELGTVEV